MSDSLRRHGLYSLWNSPGQNYGVGSHFLLQGIFLTQGLNPGLLHCRRTLYQSSHQRSPVSSRKLEFTMATETVCCFPCLGANACQDPECELHGRPSMGRGPPVAQASPTGGWHRGPRLKSAASGVFAGSPRGPGLTRALPPWGVCEGVLPVATPGSSPRSQQLHLPGLLYHPCPREPREKAESPCTSF